jgi:hypothetical protein
MLAADRLVAQQRACGGVNLMTPVDTVFIAP